MKMDRILYRDMYFLIELYQSIERNTTKSAKKSQEKSGVERNLKPAHNICKYLI